MKPDRYATRCLTCNVYVYNMDKCNMCSLDEYRVTNWAKTYMPDGSVRVSTMAPNFMGLMVEYGGYIPAELADDDSFIKTTLEFIIFRENDQYSNRGFGRSLKYKGAES